LNAGDHILLQRLVRLKDAPRYLGLDKNFFNREVRPVLTEIRIGRAVLFDREDLDDWVEYAKQEHGRSPTVRHHMQILLEFDSSGKSRERR
jgi:hypothetical protein